MYNSNGSDTCHIRKAMTNTCAEKIEYKNCKGKNKNF